MSYFDVEDSMTYKEIQSYRKKQIRESMKSYKWPRDRYKNDKEYCVIFDQSKQLWSYLEFSNLVPLELLMSGKDVLSTIHNYCELEEGGIYLDINDYSVLIAGLLLFGCKIGKWMDYINKENGPKKLGYVTYAEVQPLPWFH